MIRSKLVGLGRYLPSRVVTNRDLEKLMDTSDDWIIQRTGIRERRWVEPGECTSDLALKAATKALEHAGIAKSSIDLIVFATLSPDHDFPGTGCFLQAKLELPGVPTIDIRQQCTGFIYGLSIADQFIRTGQYKTALVVGAEIHSRGLEKSTSGRDVSVLFGDGAGAAVLTAVEVKNKDTEPYLWSTHLHTDGRFARELWTPAPGSNLDPDDRITESIMKQGLHYPKMEGKKVFVSAVRRMSESLLECTAFNGVTVEKVDRFFFHQANLRINEAVGEQLQIPSEKVFNTIHKYGNTTAATIPIGLTEALECGKLNKGDLVALSAFGSGYTWASALLRF